MSETLREKWKKAALEASKKGEVLSVDAILSLFRTAVEGLENYHWHNPTGKKLVFEDEVLALIDAGKGKA